MKTDLKPILVYQNIEHEETSKQQLEAARQSLQKLLDAWLNLDLGSVNDLYDLLMRPKICYQTAVEKLTLIPETKSRFKLSKEKYLEQLELPDPGVFLSARNEALRYTYAVSPGLWQIIEDKVELVESDAQMLIDSQSIYACDPEKIRLAKDLTNLCELLNSLNTRLAGELLPQNPWTYNWCRGKFILTQKSNYGVQEVAPDTEFLRKVLQQSL